MTGLHLAEATVREVPEGAAWLTPAEQRALAALRVPKRRDDWRLGRWVAKRAIARCLGALTGAAGRGPASMLAPARIEVLPAPDGAPEPTIEGDRALPGRLAVSISHSHGAALAGAVLGGGAPGVDLEAIERRTDRFIHDYFTAAEAERVRAAPATERDLLATLTWSAKEAALKALRTGLRLDTRAVVVEQIGDAHFLVRVPDGGRWRGEWRAAGGFVRTVVRAPG